jgi:hypothetical protein
MATEPRDKVDATIDAMSIEDLRRYVNYIAEILYFDADAMRWDVNKELDGDALSTVLELFPSELRTAVLLESDAASAAAEDA